jgi:hypothetical protein
VNLHTDPSLASWSAISLPSVASQLFTHISYMFSQLHVELMAIPDQFWGDPVVA